MMFTQGCPITTFFSNKREEILEQIITLANISSYSYDVKGLNSIANRLEHMFAPLSHTTTRHRIPPKIQKKLNGTHQTLHFGPLLSFQGGPPHATSPILLMGHMDTVYPSLPHPPYIEGDRLHGPGVADMKGGLVLIYYALQYLYQTEQVPPFVLLINPDEEIGSVGSKHLLKKLIPHVSCALMCEPSLPNGNLVSQRPAIVNAMLCVKGVASHMGRDPQKGKSAVVALSDAIVLINQLGSIQDEKILNFGKILGGTAANTIPEHAASFVSIRTPTTRVLEEMLADIQQHIEHIEAKHRVDCTFEIIGKKEAKPLDTKTQQLLEKIRSLDEHIPPISWQPTFGTSDGNLTHALHIPTVDTLGPIGHHLHSPQEFLEIPSLVTRGVLLTKTLQSLGQD